MMLALKILVTCEIQKFKNDHAEKIKSLTTCGCSYIVKTTINKISAMNPNSIKFLKMTSMFEGLYLGRYKVRLFV